MVDGSKEPRTDDLPYQSYEGETGASPTRRTRNVLVAICFCGFLVFIVLAVRVLFRHDGWVHPEIQGVVKDASGQGIEDVTVQIVRSEYTDKSTTTDSDGRFKLDAVSAKEFSFPGAPLKTTDLLMTRDGYASQRTQLSLTTSELSGRQPPPERTVEIAMEPRAEQEKRRQRLLHE